jgi:hypothetical protein
MSNSAAIAGGGKKVSLMSRISAKAEAHGVPLSVQMDLTWA